MSHIPPFYLKLESMAAPMTPQEALDHLIAISRRLDLIVRSSINGLEVTVYPTTDTARAKIEFTKALKTKDRDYVVLL